MCLLNSTSKHLKYSMWHLEEQLSWLKSCRSACSIMLFAELKPQTANKCLRLNGLFVSLS